MDDFLTKYGLGLILCGIGSYFVIVSYMAPRAGRSGVPIVGGVLIAVGFLTTPYKWLALLGLLDSGFAGIVYVIVDERRRRKMTARFEAVFRENGFLTSVYDENKAVIVRIKEREEELERRYCTSHLQQLWIPPLYYAICADSEGRRFLLTARSHKQERPDISDFGESVKTLTLTDKKGREYHIEIEIRDKVQR